MEELISIFALILFGVISIVSKIVNSQLQKPKNDLVVKPSKGARVKKSQRIPQAPLAAANKKTTDTTEKHHMLDNKKALIPDDDDEKTEKTKPEPVLVRTEIKDIIHETEIGTIANPMAKMIRNNRRFAIISHEILGKPKALQ